MKCLLAFLLVTSQAHAASYFFAGAQQQQLEYQKKQAAEQQAQHFACAEMKLNACFLNAAVKNELRNGRCAANTNGFCSYVCTEGLWIYQLDTCSSTAR